MNRDDEFDLDLDSAARRLGATETPKKKAKSKAKAKKIKDDSDTRVSSKNSPNLPLSMLPGTSEDKAQYELKFSAFKNNSISPKEYKTNLRFKVGEVLNHKTFGIGFVVAESGLNKMEVLFPTGRKLLIMGMGAAKG